MSSEADSEAQVWSGELTDSSWGRAKPALSSIFLSASSGPPRCWMPFSSSSSMMPTSPTT